VRGRHALLEGALTGEIITCFYRTYDDLGFGFLESVYRRALLVELRERGLKAEPEAALDVYYRGIEVGHFRADILVERKVIVEIEASRLLVAADRKQLLNYLRASSIELGMLLHFGPKPAFHRFIHTRELRFRNR
jgi:GxxExxY protein